MGVRENAKGTVLAQRMGWPADLFANAMHLVAATIRTITWDHQDEDTEEEEG